MIYVSNMPQTKYQPINIKIFKLSICTVCFFPCKDMQTSYMHQVLVFVCDIYLPEVELNNMSINFIATWHPIFLLLFYYLITTNPCALKCKESSFYII